MVAGVLGRGAAALPALPRRGAAGRGIARRCWLERGPLALRRASPALLIGTVGLAAEWGWSHVWMPLPWPSSLLPEARVVTVLAGVAGGLLGAFIGSALLRAAAAVPARRARSSPARRAGRRRR